jgi:hypothetical protein
VPFVRLQESILAGVAEAIQPISVSLWVQSDGYQHQISNPGSAALNHDE